MSAVDPDAPSAPDRQPTVCTAELVSRASDGESPSLYRMQVSLSGVYVETDQELPVGSIVTLQIALPRQGKELKTVARVSYRLDAAQAAAVSRRPGVGMELLDVWGREASESVEQLLEDTPGAAQNAEDVLVGAKVLIVDDDATYRSREVEGMRAAGCRVLTAKNGVEGLSIAVRETPDLIISDVNMPGLDGWQLLRLLRTKSNLRNTPVIFLTELKDEADRLRGYRLGVDDYLAKPFTAEELSVRARRALERVVASTGGAGMRGKLTDIPMAALLTMTEMERFSGSLALAREREKATLHLRTGRVIRIDLEPPYDKLEGIDRFFHVLDWLSGSFELAVGEVEGEDTLDLRTSYVLIEHARRTDEG